jgi:DNA repair photolyase
MRWATQEITQEASGTLPGLARVSNLIRSVQTPEFAGLIFHEVLAKSALNRVSNASRLPFDWTINPYRGCSHACVYCFARPSHAYLGLDGGRDFEAQLIVKVNVAEVLAAELARPTWKCEHVALGTNTDPYQRAEGRYRLMPGIIAALAASRTPFSILTKGTLLRRDLPLLADAAREVRVSLAMSIAVFDDDLQRSIEPGAPTTAARLATVTAAREAGLDVAVFIAPILPFLTDSEAQLDNALRRIRDVGATSVTYDILNLRRGVREWYAGWVRRERPDLIPRYREVYGDGAYATRDYHHRLADRMGALMRKCGLEQPEYLGTETEATGGGNPPQTTPTLF